MWYFRNMEQFEYVNTYQKHLLQGPVKVKGIIENLSAGDS